MDNDIVLRGGPTAAFPYFKLDKIQAKPLYGCLLALECAAHVLAHIEALACRPQGSPSPQDIELKPSRRADLATTIDMPTTPRQRGAV